MDCDCAPDDRCEGLREPENAWTDDRGRPMEVSDLSRAMDLADDVMTMERGHRSPSWSTEEYAATVRAALARQPAPSEGLREAAEEMREYGDALAGLITVLPAECRQEGDTCVLHGSEWSTRDGVSLGHCEWIEARTEIVPEWRAAERRLSAALARPSPAPDTAEEGN